MFVRPLTAVPFVEIRLITRQVPDSWTICAWRAEMVPSLITTSLACDRPTVVLSGFNWKIWPAIGSPRPTRRGVPLITGACFRASLEETFCPISPGLMIMVSFGPTARWSAGTARRFSFFSDIIST